MPTEDGTNQEHLRRIRYDTSALEDCLSLISTRRRVVSICEPARSALIRGVGDNAGAAGAGDALGGLLGGVGSAVGGALEGVGSTVDNVGAGTGDLIADTGTAVNDILFGVPGVNAPNLDTNVAGIDGLGSLLPNVGTVGGLPATEGAGALPGLDDPTNVLPGFGAPDTGIGGLAGGLPIISAAAVFQMLVSVASLIVLMVSLTTFPSSVVVFFLVLMDSTLAVCSLTRMAISPMLFLPSLLAICWMSFLTCSGDCPVRTVSFLAPEQPQVLILVVHLIPITSFPAALAILRTWFPILPLAILVMLFRKFSAVSLALALFPAWVAVFLALERPQEVVASLILETLFLMLTLATSSILPGSLPSTGELPGLGDLRNIIPGVVNDATNIIPDVLGNLPSVGDLPNVGSLPTTGDLSDVVPDLISGHVGDITPDGLGGIPTGGLSGVTDRLPDTSGVLPGLGGVPDVSNVLDPLLTAPSLGLPDLGATGGNPIDNSVGGLLPGGALPVGSGNPITDVADGLGDVISDAGNAVGGVINNLIPGAVPSLGDAIGNVGNTVGEVINDLTPGIPGFPDTSLSGLPTTDVPSAPGLPTVPDAGATIPSVPTDPITPGIDGDAPAPSGLPNLPTSEIPTLSNLPNITVPELHNPTIPEIPTLLSGLPGLPSLPGTPTMSGRPALPDTSAGSNLDPFLPLSPRYWTPLLVSSRTP